MMLESTRSLWAHSTAALLGAMRPRSAGGGPAIELGRKLLFDLLWPTCRERRPVFEFQATTRHGVRMSGTTADLIPALIYYLGMIEDNLTYWVVEQLRSGDVFVDVGAHMGYFSLLAARCVGPSGGVVAVEASPTTFSLLQRNLDMNPELTRRIRPLNVCASDVEGRVGFFEAPAHHTGGSSIRQRPGDRSRVEVPATTLANVLTREEVRRARLIKIDVEGAEFEAVAGLAPVLDEASAVEVVVETAPDWEHAGRTGTADDMIRVFAERGFRAYGLRKQSYVTCTRHMKPARLERDPGWGTFDLVFSRRDEPHL